jgi:hypothetical protein
MSTHVDLCYAVSANDIGAVKRCLANPDIDVNQFMTRAFPRTIFEEACSENKVEVIQVLLRDPRVDVNKAAQFVWTPLHFLAYHGNERMIAEVIASGRNLVLRDVDVEGEEIWSPLQTARRQAHYRAAALLKMAEDDPQRAVIHCRNRLYIPQASKVLCLLVLISDEYIQSCKMVSPWSFAGHQDASKTLATKVTRFFRICEQLPFDLQSVVCLRLFRLPHSVIKPRDFDQGLAWFRKGCNTNQSMFL